MTIAADVEAARYAAVNFLDANRALQGSLSRGLDEPSATYTANWENLLDRTRVLRHRLDRLYKELREGVL